MVIFGLFVGVLGITLIHFKDYFKIVKCGENPTLGGETLLLFHVKNVQFYLKVQIFVHLAWPYVEFIINKAKVHR